MVPPALTPIVHPHRFPHSLLPPLAHLCAQGDMLYPLTEPGGRQSCANPGYSLGSGWVWRSPSTGKWLVNWSQSNKVAGPGQSIFFAEYVTFWLIFLHFDRFELDLHEHTQVRGAAVARPRLKLADTVLI